MSKQSQEKVTASAVTDLKVTSTSTDAPVTPAAPVATPILQKLNYRYKLGFYSKEEQVKVAVTRQMQTAEELYEAHGGKEVFYLAVNLAIGELLQEGLRKAIEAHFAGHAELNSEAERKAFSIELATFCQKWVSKYTLPVPAEFIIAREKARQAAERARQEAIYDEMFSKMAPEMAEMYRKKLADARDSQ